jgi:hypothetical protein
MTCACVRFCAKLGMLIVIAIKVIENAKMASANEII